MPVLYQNVLIMSKIVIFVRAAMIFFAGALLAPQSHLFSQQTVIQSVSQWGKEGESRNPIPLDGTVSVYPNVLQEHDLLYFCVELQNKSNEPVMGHRLFEGGSFRTFLVEPDLVKLMEFKNYYASRGNFRELARGQNKIEANESWVACNSVLEFPEYLAPRGHSRTTIGRERGEQEDKAQNSNFIRDYVGTGKKFKLGVKLWATEMLFSEPIIEAKTRDAKEMAAIKAWHAEFNNFLSDTSRVLEHRSRRDPQFPHTWKKVPTVQDYEAFEKQLSAGTLKNYIHFRKLLASIPDDTDPANPDIGSVRHVPDEHFKKLADYLDALHPIERGALTRDALWYFWEGSNNSNTIKYVLLPKLPRSERERYFGGINLNDREKFLELLALPELK